MNALAAVEAEPLTQGLSPAPRPESPGAPNERLRPVAAPAARPKKSPVMGAIIAVCVILGIFAAQLALSILVSQGAYESRALEIEERDLGRVERVLSQNLDKLASPQNLVDNAAALGMVQNVAPATMRLSDGAIQGSLDSTTREASANLVPNAQLESLPVLGAEGFLTDRDAPDEIVPDAATAVAWQGKLPAPLTR